MYFSANFTTIEFTFFINSHRPTINTTLLCTINKSATLDNYEIHCELYCLTYCSTFFSKKKKNLVFHFVVRCGQSWSLISQAWLLWSILQVKGWLILIVEFGV